MGFKKELTHRERAEENLQQQRNFLESLIKSLTQPFEKEISHRKRVEEKIRQQKDFLETLIESLTHPFYVVDTNNYKIVMANSEAKKLCNSSENITCYTLTHKVNTPCDDIEEHPCPMRVMKKTKKPVTVEHIHYDPDGNARNVEVHAYPILDDEGHVIQMIEYTFDITRRKQVEEELETYRRHLEHLVEQRTIEFKKANAQLEQEIIEHRQIEGKIHTIAQRLEAVFETVGEGITLSDETGYFDIFNSKMEVITGYTKEDANNSDDFLALLYPQPSERQTAIDGIHQVRQTEKYRYVETTIRAKDGTMKTLLVSTSLVPSQNKIYFLSAYHDITARKRTEIELQKAKEAAEVANHAKSEFLANISHEFRTPLNAILGYTQILIRTKSLTKKQKEAIDTIHHSSEHLLMMINELLDLSRIEARKLELEPADVYLPGFLKGIVEIARIRAQQEGISFECEIAPDLPIGVHVDGKRLRQILINLLGNGIKFTEQGRVLFRVLNNRFSAKERNAKSLTANIRFQVEDMGIGIPSDKLEDIFLPFQQVHTGQPSTEGTGLGLPISRKLISTMGSELHVRSVVGQGTTFWFDLEVPKVEGIIVSEAQPSHHVFDLKGETRKIVIVDDKDKNRAVLKDMLVPLGFKIVEATDGHDALAKATTFHPDIILMDLIMPVMDGFETTRRIRQVPELQGVIVVGISANAFATARQESLRAGCDDFLVKPIQLNDLLEKLHVHLKLEWLDEGKHEAQTTETELKQQPIVAPPAEELVALYELTVAGDVKSILERIKEIEAVKPALAAFAAQVCQFTEAFLLDDLEKFIKQYMEVSKVPKVS